MSILSKEQQDNLAAIAHRLPSGHNAPLCGAILSAIPREWSPRATLCGKLAPEWPVTPGWCHGPKIRDLHGDSERTWMMLQQLAEADSNLWRLHCRSPA
jgi:hypothetical protein